MQGLQIGDCLGLWGDAEAPGNAADAGRSRIPGLARGAPAEAASLSSRSAGPNRCRPIALQCLRCAVLWLGCQELASNEDHSLEWSPGSHTSDSFGAAAVSSGQLWLYAGQL